MANLNSNRVRRDAISTLAAPRRFTISILAFAAASLLAVCPAGCASRSPKVPTTSSSSAATPTRNAPATIIVIGDTSPSNLGNLGDEIGAYADLLPLLPEGTLERIYRIDSGLRLVRVGESLSSADDFLAQVWTQLSAPALNRGTHMRLAAEEAERQGESAPGDVVVIVFSDWACEGETPEARTLLRKSLARIAGNAKLKAFVVVGADPVYSQAMLADLAPFPVGKLHVKESTNLDLSFVAEALGR